MPRRRMEAAVRVLREKCLFTAEQLTEVLQSCPGVLLEEPGSLQYHFQVRGAGWELWAQHGTGAVC